MHGYIAIANASDDREKSRPDTRPPSVMGSGEVTEHKVDGLGHIVHQPGYRLSIVQVHHRNAGTL